MVEPAADGLGLNHLDQEGSLGGTVLRPYRRPGRWMSLTLTKEFG